VKKFITLLIIGFVTLALSGYATVAPAADAYKGVTGLKIGFSNSYNGNSYRQNLEAGFVNCMEDLKKQGIVDSWTMTVSNNDIATQISDIQSMILAGVDAIVLVAGSTTALTDVVKEAVDAKIPVISINQGPLVTDVTYEIVPDWKEMAVWLAENSIAYAKKQQGTEDVKGNVLLVRGFAGTATDTKMQDGYMEVLAKYPGLKVVAEVYGEWTHSVALTVIEQALPSLPEIDFVLGQGGDGYAAVLAFQNAKRKLPLIVGGNRGDFLNWWMSNPEYVTFSASGNGSAMGSASGYLAVEILNGNTDFAKSRIMIQPALKVTNEDLMQFKGIRNDGVAGTFMTWDKVKTELMTQVDAWKGR
jgi:ribose transport system substrate-binding protein